jgi:hypothetical protein
VEEIETKKPRFTSRHHMQAELINNPGSGAVGVSLVQLMDMSREMQAWILVPEAYLVEPDRDRSLWSRKLSGTGYACSSSVGAMVPLMSWLKPWLAQMSPWESFPLVRRTI